MLLTNITFGQTYSEQNKKCSEILKDVPIGDSIFWEKLELRNKCLLGLKAPNFSVKTLDKELIDIDSLKGKVLFLNFWFTKCTPCIKEMPLLNKLKTSFKDKDILFLSFANEDSTKISEFLKKTRFNFKHIPHGGTILIETFKLFSIWPTTIIIDKEGIIRFIKVGELNDKIDFHKKLITNLLRKKLLPT
ncbi:MAG: TlpA disulfide reductase family protein [Chitinophagaceae bacterium]